MPLRNVIKTLYNFSMLYNLFTYAMFANNHTSVYFLRNTLFHLLLIFAIGLPISSCRLLHSPFPLSPHSATLCLINASSSALKGPFFILLCWIQEGVDHRISNADNISFQLTSCCPVRRFLRIYRFRLAVKV